MPPFSEKSVLVVEIRIQAGVEICILAGVETRTTSIGVNFFCSIADI